MRAFNPSFAFNICIQTDPQIICSNIKENGCNSNFVEVLSRAMVKRYKELCLLILSVLIFTLAPVPVSANSNVKGSADQSLYLLEDLYAAPWFSSHLPLIVIEFKGKDDNGYVALESTWLEDDWFNNSVISVYDNTNGGENTLQDEPNLTAISKIQLLADWETENREKHDYYIRLEDSAGQAEEHELLGLPANSEYWLLGSMYDKSLIRNYLGYTLAAEIMGNAPKVQFCEVLLQTEEGLLYQGVYLLIERTYAETGVYIKRLPEEAAGIPLYTQYTQTVSGLGALVVPFYEPEQTEESLLELTQDLSYIEDILASQETTRFLQYKNLIDENSFINYFIANELLGNYDAALNSFYSYQNTSKHLLQAGPVWNFERSLDNEVDTSMELSAIPLAEAPFYTDLIKSVDFVNALKSRYKELGIGSLNVKNLMNLIDSTVEFLEPAQARDWARWKHVYQYDPLMTMAPYPSEDADKPSRLRQTGSYEQEIMKLKYVLREHSLQIGEAIPLLYREDNLITEADNYERNTMLFVAFFAIFMVSIALARRQSLR